MTTDDQRSAKIDSDNTFDNTSELAALAGLSLRLFFLFIEKLNLIAIIYEFKILFGQEKARDGYKRAFQC